MLRAVVAALIIAGAGLSGCALATPRCLFIHPGVCDRALINAGTI